MGKLIRDADLLTAGQTYKGWLFVLVTAALVYFLVRQYYLRSRRTEEPSMAEARRSASLAFKPPMRGLFL